MAVENFKATVWVANLLVALRKQLVSEAGVNHNYEGEVLEGGSVKINKIAEVTLKDYNGNAIEYDDVDTTVQTLSIDHVKYFGVKLDDVDGAQVKDKGELMTKAMESAAYQIANDRDQENFKAMAEQGTLTFEATVSDAASAKKLVLDAKTKADAANVPKDGRVLFAPPQLENMLLADQTISLATPTTDDALKAGYIGKLYGIEIYSTNNLPEGKVVLTHPAFTTEATQISKVEALRSENSFKDLVRGLDMSGRKVIMPEGVVVATVTFS
jgi:hypothetical protein